jgi:hypothetical protein
MTPERGNMQSEKQQRRLLIDNGYLKHFRGNEYACINQSVLWPQRITEESTGRLGVLYSVRTKFVQSAIQTAREREREREREFQRIEDSVVEALPSNDQ